MMNSIAIRFSSLTKAFCAIGGTVFSLLSVVLSFLSWNDLGVSSAGGKILVFIVLLIFCMTTSFVYVFFLKRKSVILQSGEKRIVIRYGDIIKFGFPRWGKKKRIIIIPVNSAFDTIVDENISNIEHPLVSPCSIHGQWLNRMISDKCTVTDLNNQIQSQLQMSNAKVVSRLQKKRGNSVCYSIGTIIPILGTTKDVTFWLLADAEFNDSNNAESCADGIEHCIDMLVDYVDKHSQGYEVFIPLIGTGFARTGLTPEDMLLMMRAKLLLNLRKIHGTVNIVVYEKERFFTALS